MIPLALFAVFLAFTLPGISWGAPSGWHPDEVVSRSIKALHGEWKFSEINFDYPDLPQYAMFALGKIILGLGYGNREVLIASRVLSAILAGLTIVLVYLITRKLSGNIYTAGLAALLLLSVSEMSHNGRFAHNDTYVTFFATLTLLFLVQYKLRNDRAWLYASFVSVGMAASSKYNGVSLVIVPVLLYLISRRQLIFKRPLRIVETLFLGGALTFLGYAVGTPKALFWMTYYFKRMIPALLRTGNYARQPDSVRGILGQYPSFIQGVGVPLAILFFAAFLWACYQVFRVYVQKQGEARRRASHLLLLLAMVFALDLPILLSYNFPPRFFLSMIPVFAILGALFVEDAYRAANVVGNRQASMLISLVLVTIVVWSFARNISVMTLFLNDSRIAASAFLHTLPAGTSLEYTYYPPTIPRDHFARERNYPIYFRKDPNEPTPASNKINIGEVGLIDRSIDYLVVDSFTSDKFQNKYTCDLMQVECDFFKQLATGQSDHYKLIAEFSYALPPYLPQIQVAFVNPTIRIYERLP